ncbi:MAG TPA: hypothetical protein VFV38_15765 [Ktedonobacteraceae bacterium]|nr:hypothetical protein [Ktedonobacteraceae bacterium]
MRLFSLGQTDQSMAREKRAVSLVALGESQAFCLADRDKPGKTVFAMVPAQRTRKATT